MSDIFVCGTGAVSPAGWGMNVFREALQSSPHVENSGTGVSPVRIETYGQDARATIEIPAKELARPGNAPLRVRQVPPPNPRPPFLTHARLRRTSPIAHYAVSAALEALGEDASQVSSGAVRLGVVYCALSGCVNYSRRFYDEVLKDPATASPLVFPETVYNSPASHLAALVGTIGINYTLVGDPGTFVQGLVLAADWLTDKRVDACLVIGAEEMDWLTAGAYRLFERKIIYADGAGAIYLKREPGKHFAVRLDAVTDSHLFSNNRGRVEGIRRARAEVNGSAGRALLCDGLLGLPRPDRHEQEAWENWRGTRLSVKKILGEALMASTAWQCVAAVDALAQSAYDVADVSVAGTNQQAIAARFVRNGI
ncbi:MAG TPA: hypothetical protein VN873_07770 [Candidatus Angelobacter sp.]|nr:hypothetical protein [Candidatus Angelobacter sp.]